MTPAPPHSHPTARRIAAVMVLALLLVACGKDKTAKQLSGYQLNPAPEVGALSLPDASNHDSAFTFKATGDHYLLVYFGYTNCPDVCPTTLSNVKKALTRIGDNASKVDLAMITIDPSRDTGDLLSKYVRSFIPNAHALRTDDDTALQTTATTFGAAYTVTKDATGQENVSHTGNLYVVDATGTVVLEWPFGLQPEAMATDLDILFSGKLTS